MFGWRVNVSELERKEKSEKRLREVIQLVQKEYGGSWGEGREKWEDGTEGKRGREEGAGMRSNSFGIHFKLEVHGFTARAHKPSCS
jgi:hypothetical protein